MSADPLRSSVMSEHRSSRSHPPADRTGAGVSPATHAEPLIVPHDVHSALPGIRGAVAAAQGHLTEQFRRGESVAALIRARSRFVDDILTLGWRRFGFDDDFHHALVAVGGYGRSELHPCSDIDLLILTQGAMRSAEGERVNGFLAFLWDVGLTVGGSVRTVQECIDEAERDVTVVTNLMENRLVCGSADLREQMHERTGPRWLWPSRAFFEAKKAEQRARYHKFNDTGYNLEPNVKEGPGGLRDVQTISWVAKRHFGAETLGELVDHDFLTAGELDALESDRCFLWQVRFALHVLTRRAEERLLFDHQRSLAETLGFEDDGDRLGVEHMMRRYYRTVMELSRLNEMLLEHFEETIIHARKHRCIKPLNRRFQSVNNYIEVTREDVFRRYPFALLELFLLLQQHPELDGVRASTIRLIRENRHRIDDAFRADLRARSLFLDILRQPRGISRALRRMHRYGILGAYLPVFDRVTGRMQYDLFHTYTVDEHSLFVLRNLRLFADPAHRDEFPHCTDIFARLPKPELIYIAGLFHDIAKGFNGDHSELGSELVRAFCTSHGFGAYDTELVAWLVQHHLLMSITAQRRDISDPEIISGFAVVVGDHIHLDYLYLLTIADICGTNPGLWNDWKDALLHDLYRSTLRALLRGLDNPIKRVELVRETREEAHGLVARAGIDPQRAAALWRHFGDDYFLRHDADEIRWHTANIIDANPDTVPLVLVRNGRRGIEVFIYAPDQKFLFAASASILERLGLTVLDARIMTGNHGMTLDSYIVEDTAAVRAASIRHEEIGAALRCRLHKPAAVPRTVHRFTKRRLKHFAIPVEINFTRDVSNQRTVIEVIAMDRPGLLARIAWALADAQVRVQNARIATFGERAEDVFYVTDTHNQPLLEARFDAVHHGIYAAADLES